MKLLVIDIQKGITDDRLYNFDSFIENTVKIITEARKNNIEIIFFQHDDGPGTGFSVGDEEFEIDNRVSPKENEKVFIKTVNSCFGNEDFCDYIKAEDELMIIGLQTNFCIDATVKSAFDRNINIIIPNNANSTFDNPYMDKETTYKYYNEFLWPDRFAKCIPVEEALKLLKAN